MGCNNISLLILFILIIIIIIITITMRIDFERFQNPTTKAPQDSVTDIKTDVMNIKANLQGSTINLDPYSKDKNINIGNDIIVKNGFNITGYDTLIDIPYIRYIKSLPIHFEKKICLKDADSSDCIDKNHIEIIKGYRKINLKSYPQNYRKCLGAVNVKHKHNLAASPVDNKIFTSNKCKNGNHENDFVILRDPHSHSVSEIHYHKHLMEDSKHDNLIHIEHD
jgi:hypothetical protein